MRRRDLLGGIGLALAAAACDEAAPRALRKAKPPGALAPPGAPMDLALTGKPSREPPGPVRWDPARLAFAAQGRILRAEKQWIFDGATDGFVMTNGEVAPAEAGGLLVSATGPDSILRSPKGLNVNGHTRSLVIIRLSRMAPGAAWDGTVYYSTAQHGESALFRAKPVSGANPAVGATETLIFDMHQLRAGGEDWKTSIIDQVRIDLDDSPGGAFIIHQIALAQNPGGVTPPPPAAG